MTNTLLDLLEKIKEKPALYIGSTSVTQLRMFIIGYRFARKEMGVSSSDLDKDFYKNFQPWLQKRLSIYTVNSWDKIITLTCIDDKAAFEYFFQLLGEFSHRSKKEDVDPILVGSLNQTEKVA